MSDLRRRLERVEIPGEHEARVRTWALLAAAHERRERIAWPRRHGRALVLAAAGAAAVAALASPPGWALLGSLRDAVGREQVRPALGPLPAPGRLLVESDRGAFVVAADGSRRRLGGYRDPAWSPHGLFVAAAEPGGLVALSPDGERRWTLARAGARLPRWAGSRADTRIAYLADGAVRLVAGDGTGDRLLAAGAGAAAPAWKPGGGFVLAWADGAGRVHVDGVEHDRRFGTSPAGPPVLQLAWSGDGNRLVALTPGSLRVLDEQARPLRTIRLAGMRALAPLPGGHRFAVAHDGQVHVVDADRGRPARLFAGPGRLTGLVVSPDGRYLLVEWKDADQWLFLRTRGGGPPDAVAPVSRSFGRGGFPAVADWCCASSR